MAFLGTKSTIMPMGLANQIIDKAKSVCTITRKINDQESGGTGFLMSKNLILTASHVVDANPAEDDGTPRYYNIDFDRTDDADYAKKSFLYSATYPWDNPAANKLHSLLADAYSDNGMRLKTLIEAGVPKSRLLPSGIPFEAWMQALNIAANMGKLKPLVEVVLADPAASGFHQEIKNLLPDSSPLKAKVKFHSDEFKIAVLELDHDLTLAPLTLGTTAHLTPKDGIIIIQHPRLEAKSFCLEADGLVEFSETHIRYKVDTTAGSSGAPVFDSNMHVIGVHYSAGGAAGGLEGVILESITSAEPNIGLNIDPLKEVLKSEGLSFTDALNMDA